MGPELPQARGRGARKSFRGGAQEGESSLADLAWWDLYKDPRLSELVRASLSSGFDARIAAARVEESAPSRPRSMASSSRPLATPRPPTAAGTRCSATPTPEGGGSAGNGFDGYLGAAWELDLWGRVRRLDEAARAQYLATEEGRRAVMLSLVGDVATAYYELLELDEELAIRSRHGILWGQPEALQPAAGGRHGLAPRHRDRRGGHGNQRGPDPDLERLIAIKENQISVLIGSSPGPILRGAGLSSQSVPPDVPAGLSLHPP